MEKIKFGDTVIPDGSIARRAVPLPEPKPAPAPAPRQNAESAQ